MDKGTIIRSIALVVVAINQILVAFGKSPLPFEQEEIEQGLSAFLTVAVSIWTWFKNNYVTDKGKAQKAELEMKGLK